jgi:hypothetical protein
MSFLTTINLIAKEEYAVKEDNAGNKRNPAVVEYRNPGVALPVTDALTEVLRSGARELLQEAVEAEVAEFVPRHRELKDERQRQRVVRNGYQPAGFETTRAADRSQAGDWRWSFRLLEGAAAGLRDAEGATLLGA